MSSKAPKIPLYGKLGEHHYVVTVYNSKCTVCQQFISDNSLVIAVGPPAHSLIHFNCWPYFDVKLGYTHGKPLSSFI